MIRCAVVGEGVRHGMRKRPAPQDRDASDGRRVWDVVRAGAGRVVDATCGSRDHVPGLVNRGTLVAVDEPADCRLLLIGVRQVVPARAGIFLVQLRRHVEIPWRLVRREGPPALRAERLRGFHRLHHIIATRSWNLPCPAHLILNEVGHFGRLPKLPTEARLSGRVIRNAVVARCGHRVLVELEPLSRRIPIDTTTFRQLEGGRLPRVVSARSRHIRMGPRSVVKRRQMPRVADLPKPLGLREVLRVRVRWGVGSRVGSVVREAHLVLKGLRRAQCRWSARLRPGPRW
mmetsp:Transcript_56218/g.144732  ORF Transcript_56218/g.144732 Transcript_56218/m.144732 type:complete len:288 (+) Transcript_56218:974-1837(+)